MAKECTCSKMEVAMKETGSRAKERAGESTSMLTAASIQESTEVGLEKE